MPEADVIPFKPNHHSLAENEAIIRRGLSTFVEVGVALREIRDEQQYGEAGFASFDEYVKARWDMGRDNAYKTIAAADVSRALYTSGLPVPASVNAAAPLVAHLNDKGVYDRNAHELRYPERGYQAVIEAWRGIVEAHEDESKPITKAEVARYLYPPANTGTSASWLEAIGTVGDKIEAAAKSMDRAEQMVGARRSKAVVEKAERYADRCDQLALRLRAIAADN